MTFSFLIRCTGIRLKHCKCVSGNQYPLKQNGSNVVLVGRGESICCLHSKMVPKRNIFLRGMENLYETCAGYNMRYCPLRGFAKTDNSLSNTLKDLIVLLCFLIANFVVFMTIVTKTAVHVYFTVSKTTYWVKRSLFYMKPEDNAARHDYSPPAKYTFY